MNENESSLHAICKKCGWDSKKTYVEMSKHSWGEEYRCPNCDFVMWKDNYKLRKVASELGLIEYTPKEHLKGCVSMIWVVGIVGFVVFVLLGLF